MSGSKIENIRFSSSSVDDFLSGIPIHKTASSGVIRIGNLQHLAGFQLVADDKLVHLSRQDFWQLGQDENGYFIERLVSDDDGPVREHG
jgi:hypothetical protein